jgi:hypothetical protein
MTAEGGPKESFDSLSLGFLVCIPKWYADFFYFQQSKIFFSPKTKRADWLGGFGIIIKPKPNRSERQAKSAAGADEAV